MYGVWEEGTSLQMHFLVLFAFLFVRKGVSPHPFKSLAQYERDVGLPIMVGCSSQTVWIHREFEKEEDFRARVQNRNILSS